MSLVKQWREARRELIRARLAEQKCREMPLIVRRQKAEKRLAEIVAQMTPKQLEQLEKEAL